jgi:hypothetical protein
MSGIVKKCSTFYDQQRIDLQPEFNSGLNTPLHIRRLTDHSNVDALLVLDRIGEFHAEIPKSQWKNIAAAVDLNAAWGVQWSSHPDFSISVSLGRMDSAYIQYAQSMPKVRISIN